MESDPLLDTKRSMYTLKAVAEEAASIYAICWKISLATFCQLSVLTISTAFLGHLGTRELAASAMVMSVVGGFRIIPWAFSISISTLGGHAYGAKNYELVGVWLQIGLIMLVPVSALLMAVCLNIRPCLELMTDDLELLAMGETYAWYVSWSVWPSAIYEALRYGKHPSRSPAFSKLIHQLARGYYKAQEIMTPTTVVDVTTLFISIGVNYVFIYGCLGWPGFGFIGSPLALVFIAVIQSVSLWSFAHLLQERHTKTWFGWKAKNCLNAARLRQYLTLTGTFLVYLALDEWVYNVLAIMAARIGSLNVAAYNILFTIWTLAYGVYIGFSTPIQVRVSHALGANDPAKAKQSAVVGCAMGSFAAGFLSVAMYVGRDEMLALYTADVDLQDVIRPVLGLFCLAACLSGVHITLSAMLEAMSLAGTLVLASSVGSWLVLLPVAYELAFATSWGFGGLYIGSVIGESVKLVIMAVALVWVFDWHVVAEQVSKQVTSDNEEFDV
ncbi:hypothetical protein, variant 3 [Aphanomyces astaci]|uniref:Polysaccharide biosynthesis protein C-terminal domain-containing protein n=1 Tax=Aphanomyces astaci TaxID=112090 RepID=W4H418_APHAT|nr:hypothetical protein, variant 3 [Aphanomyces astaci]ETV86009.1 hypothetical protein, variant 3 [Aphanomyces astaci]|eukprot:XP_009824484.1 hypothetical protein, variant 3 [Aphanomyces astaci]